VGLNRSPNLVLAELSWTDAEQTQAVDRIHRIGQEEPVTAWRIIASQTIDTRIAELIDSKAGIAARALDGSDEEVASSADVQSRRRRAADDGAGRSAGPQADRRGARAGTLRACLLDVLGCGAGAGEQPAQKDTRSLPGQHSAAPRRRRRRTAPRPLLILLAVLCVALPVALGVQHVANPTGTRRLFRLTDGPVAAAEESVEVLREVARA
jgi:hypothetical protein